MKKNLLLRLDSASREDLKVHSYDFGDKNSGKKVAILSGLRGDELQSLFVTSRLIHFLKQQEEQNPNFLNGYISIIPSVNHYAFNIDERYWPLDKTAITRMFPGYADGETTQRIAHTLFENLKGYDFGIRLSTGYRNVFQIPHIKLYETDFLMPETKAYASYFGLKYIHTTPPSPFDTVTIGYNWELWGVHSYVFHGGACGAIDDLEALNMLNALIRFLSKIGVINYEMSEAYLPVQIQDTHLLKLKTSRAGIFFPYVKTGDVVNKGQLLGEIFDTLEGDVIERIVAPVTGVVFAYTHGSLIFQNAAAVILAKK